MALSIDGTNRSAGESEPGENGGFLDADVVATVRGHTGAKDVVLGERRRNRYASTWTTQTVECTLDGSRRLSVFLKWSEANDATEKSALDHTRLAYEASVYTTVLAQAHRGTAAFYGFNPATSDGRSLLVIEHLAEGVRIDETPEPWKTLTAAAEWVGRFHSLHAGRSPQSLASHDAEYFAGWIERTATFSEPLREEHPWLRALGAAHESLAEELDALERTVIHGEFTPHNVLVAASRIAPIDWESAAVSVGAIDVVSLTDRWPQGVVQACEEAYFRERWPQGAPSDLPRVLDLARCYWHCRWLGRQPEWTMRERSRWRFGDLAGVLTRLGVI